MGGYSEICPFCDKWFLDAKAIKNHVKGKHSEFYDTWMIATYRRPLPKDSCNVKDYVDKRNELASQFTKLWQVRCQ